MTISDCVICLSQLQSYEVEFPLLCPTKCTNVCSTCINHLEQAGSPSAYSCPKCRAELSSQLLEDTRFMRAVRKLEDMVQAGTSDSEMSGKELRMKYSVTPSQIESTKRRLEEYEVGTDSSVQTLVTNASGSQNQKQTPKVSSALSDKIDMPLLDGLASFMSEEEQVYITELMTSGETRKLAQGAQILSEIRRLNVIDENIKPMTSQWTRNSSVSMKRAIKMASPDDGGIPLPPMPKHVILSADFNIYARHGKILKFKDDVWDGSMADAFARAYASNSGSHSNDDESDHSDDSEEHLGDEEGFLNDGDKKKNRVLVTCSRGQAAKAGIKNQDVVTHINNDEFLGNAEDLKTMIQNCCEDIDMVSFTMVLNAEQSTADELKKRAKN